MNDAVDAAGVCAEAAVVDMMFLLGSPDGAFWRRYAADRRFSTPAAADPAGEVRRGMRRTSRPLRSPVESAPTGRAAVARRAVIYQRGTRDEVPLMIYSNQEKWSSIRPGD
jgi:hypothetical protein